jgi:hypothetical protein
VGESALYQTRKAQLLAALQERLGDRVLTPPLKDYVRHLPEGAP